MGDCNGWYRRRDTNEGPPKSWPVTFFETPALASGNSDSILAGRPCTYGWGVGILAGHWYEKDDGCFICFTKDNWACVDADGHHCYSALWWDRLVGWLSSQPDTREAVPRFTGPAAMTQTAMVLGPPGEGSTVASGYSKWGQWVHGEKPVPTVHVVGSCNGPMIFFA